MMLKRITFTQNNGRDTELRYGILFPTRCFRIPLLDGNTALVRMVVIPLKGLEPGVYFAEQFTDENGYPRFEKFDWERVPLECTCLEASAKFEPMPRESMIREAFDLTVQRMCILTCKGETCDFDTMYEERLLQKDL